MFYVGFLQPAPQSTIPGWTFPEPPSVLVDNEEEVEVENILDLRIYRGQLQYLVKWKGYSDAENTWEVQDKVRNAMDLVRLFHQRHRQAPALAPRCPRGRRSGGGDVMRTAHRHAVT